MSVLNGFQLTTPVVFIIFNRFKEAEAVFEQIALAKPQKLFVISDGPRPSKPGELEEVNRVRSLMSRIDWPCEIYKNFADRNLGCRDRIASGLDWVFDQVESAIILEDDCLPDPTFFRYCQELLEKHKNAHEISHITGTSIVDNDMTPAGDSYWFSDFAQVWGWATWSRVWKEYDVEASNWPDLKKAGTIKSRSLTPGGRRYWKNAFSSVYKRKMDTWDYQFSLLTWTKNMKTIVPNRNLISNIGFGNEATHTLNSNSVLANLPLHSMQFPMRHPSAIQVDRGRDLQLSRALFEMSSLIYAINYFHQRMPRFLNRATTSLYRKMSRQLNSWIG